MTTTHSDLTGISAFGPARATVQGSPLSQDELRNMDSYWSACCYLILGMLYLRENPLLREPLKAEHIKPRLLGHWGSSPGQSFIWLHLNRIIKKYDTVRRGSGFGTGLQVAGAHAKERFKNEQIACRNYAYEHGIDKPQIVNWKWPF